MFEPSTTTLANTETTVLNTLVQLTKPKLIRQTNAPMGSPTPSPSLNCFANEGSPTPSLGGGSGGGVTEDKNRTLGHCV